MPNLIALGAAASATALTLVLGLTFWPQAETLLTPGKAAVSQPIFVNSPPVRSIASAAPATGGAADASAMAKLAVALQANPSANSGSSAATRSVTLPVASPAAPPPVS